MSKKKPVVLKPFHEVALETLEQGEESEAYKWFSKLLNYGQDGALAAIFYLTRCIVPEEAKPAIVPALIAAAKGVPGDNDEVANAVASALIHFKPGKRGLKEIGKLLQEEYLKCRESSDEESRLRDLFVELKLDVPDRPEKESKKAKAKKPVGKAAAKKKPAAKKAKPKWTK